MLFVFQAPVIISFDHTHDTFISTRPFTNVGLDLCHVKYLMCSKIFAYKSMIFRCKCFNAIMCPVKDNRGLLSRWVGLRSCPCCVPWHIYLIVYLPVILVYLFPSSMSDDRKFLINRLVYHTQKINILHLLIQGTYCFCELFSFLNYSVLLSINYFFQLVFTFEICAVFEKQ